MRRFALSVVLLSTKLLWGCAKLSEPRSATAGPAASPNGVIVEYLTPEDKRYYSPVVWRFRVPGGWIYVVAYAGDSTIRFVPDPQAKTIEVPQ